MEENKSGCFFIKTQCILELDDCVTLCTKNGVEEWADDCVCSWTGVHEWWSVIRPCALCQGLSHWWLQPVISLLCQFNTEQAFLCLHQLLSAGGIWFSGCPCTHLCMHDHMLKAC